MAVFHGNSVLNFLLKEQGFDKFVAVVAVVADVSLVTVASQVQAFCVLRKLPVCVEFAAATSYSTTSAPRRRRTSCLEWDSAHSRWVCIA